MFSYVVDISQSNHQLARVGTDSNKIIFATNSFQFCDFKTPQQIFLDVEICVNTTFVWTTFVNFPKLCNKLRILLRLSQRSKLNLVPRQEKTTSMLVLITTFHFQTYIFVCSFVSNTKRIASLRSRKSTVGLIK